jgi:glutamate--cysteine ligase
VVCGRHARDAEGARAPARCALATRQCSRLARVFAQGRYKIMREYMPKVGSMGLDMMFRTCTVQVA